MADIGADSGRDGRGYQWSSDQSYNRGYRGGVRSRPTRPDMPPAIWKGLILLCHPDKYMQEPGLQALAGEVTRWLLEHRPSQN
jgi:hypothetical protein